MSLFLFDLRVTSSNGNLFTLRIPEWSEMAQGGMPVEAPNLVTCKVEVLPL